MPLLFPHFGTVRVEALSLAFALVGERVRLTRRSFLRLCAGLGSPRLRPQLACGLAVRLSVAPFVSRLVAHFLGGRMRFLLT